MLKSLRVRVLALVAAFGLLTAVALQIMMYNAVQNYYINVVYQQAGEFLDRVIATTPTLWSQYEANKQGFSDELQRVSLYAAHTGVYLIDLDGRVLATSGEGKIFWSNYRVDLVTAARSLVENPIKPVYGDDPDVQGAKCVVAMRAVAVDGAQKAWLYVVARAAGLGADTPELMAIYAWRTSVTAALVVLAVSVLLTMAMMAILTRPLIALTSVAEQVKRSGFQQELREELFPHGHRFDEIGRLSRSFRDMFERLKLEMGRVTRTDVMRREMVANVSHDLRTPLTALMGQLETIKMKRDLLSAAEQLSLIDRALQNADQLRRLTDALAELGRLDNPEFSAQPEPIAIGELADDVVQRHSTRAQGQSVELIAEYSDGLPLAKVDAGLIERALSNLLDNALRVTPTGGKITVRVRNDTEAMRIEVIDTGPGVSGDDLNRVFDRFYQTSGHRELRGSSGLGLAIVKRVAELHGGHAGIVSVPGQGATFFLSLPGTAA